MGTFRKSPENHLNLLTTRVKHSPSYSKAKRVTLELTTHDHVPYEPYPSLGSPQATECGQKIENYRWFFVIIDDDGTP